MATNMCYSPITAHMPPTQQATDTNELCSRGVAAVSKPYKALIQPKPFLMLYHVTETKDVCCNCLQIQTQPSKVKRQSFIHLEQWKFALCEYST